MLIRRGLKPLRAAAFLLAVALVSAAGDVRPAYAQPALVEASPEPDAVLTVSPSAIVLTFDRALADSGSWLTVVDQSGQRFDLDDPHVDPANRSVLSVSLAPLPEGRYRVAYRAQGVGSSTVVVGRYEFTVDLPDPTLSIISPVTGQAFHEPRVPLEFKVRFFDFGLYNNRIHLYVDGEHVADLRALNTTLEGLEPGVHEIKAVLARFENEELPETASTVIVAVAQPDIELEGRRAAAAAPPDTGLQLSALQWVLVILATTGLLGFGIWLGRLR